MIRTVLPMALLVLAASAQAVESPEVADGRRVAQRVCGECHAVGEGPSPLAEAPPFRTLYTRYPPGGLDALLSEGMLPSDHPPEEGRQPGHWRMGTMQLDGDQVATLKAYLRSLDPRPGSAAR